MLLFRESSVSMKQVVRYHLQFRDQFNQIQKAVVAQIGKTKKKTKSKAAKKLAKKYKSPYFMESLQELNKETRLYEHGQMLSETVLHAQPGQGFGWDFKNVSAVKRNTKHKAKAPQVENPFLMAQSAAESRYGYGFYSLGMLSGLAGCCFVFLKEEQRWPAFVTSIIV